MQRLASGHDAALSELMHRYGEPLFRYLVRALQNESEAADLAEEAFVRVYQNAHRFDPCQKFSTWLYAIASNLVRDRFRWRTRHPEVSADAASDFEESWLHGLPDRNPEPGESLESAERAEAVRRAIAALSEDLQIPLILAEYEGLSHAEIAEITGGTAKSVEMRIYRARKLLRERLAGLLKEA
jgi:RNA polymerase sigma-70 factor (ECF subfamily)